MKKQIIFQRGQVKLVFSLPVATFKIQRQGSKALKRVTQSGIHRSVAWALHEPLLEMQNLRPNARLPESAFLTSPQVMLTHMKVWELVTYNAFTETRRRQEYSLSVSLPFCLESQTFKRKMTLYNCTMNLSEGLVAQFRCLREFRNKEARSESTVVTLNPFGQRAKPPRGLQQTECEGRR